MGQLVSIIKAFSCESCNKYVFNAFHSKCACTEHCFCTLDTDLVEVSDADSETEFEVSDCCVFRHID